LVNIKIHYMSCMRRCRILLEKPCTFCLLLFRRVMDVVCRSRTWRH